MKGDIYMSDKSLNIIPDAVNDAAKNLTELPTKNIGTTLADCWFLIFGGLSQLADKRRVKYSMELEKFKKELQASLDKVPNKQKQEPSTQIVMSALNDARYCIEEDELRHLFVNLISSSTDSSKSVHPSFSNIIKQMSPIDAKIVTLFKYKSDYPICHITQRSNNDDGYIYLKQNFFINEYHNISIDEVSIAISSLIYLGILEVPHDLHYTDTSIYNSFTQSDYYEQFLNAFPNSGIGVEHHLVRLTNLGELFVSCCVAN